MKITDSGDDLVNTNSVPRMDLRTPHIPHGMWAQQEPHFKEEEIGAWRR